VRGVSSKRVQCDEIWAFCYAKQRNVATAKAAPEEAGDVWTWTGRWCTGVCLNLRWLDGLTSGMAAELSMLPGITR